MAVDEKSVDAVCLLVSQLRSLVVRVKCGQRQLVLADGAAVVARPIAHVSFLFERQRLLQQLIPSIYTHTLQIINLPQKQFSS